MLTYNECLHLSDLTQDEVEAIAEHEHTDPIIAMAIGQYLCCHNGESKVKKIILDDIAKAQRKGDYADGFGEGNFKALFESIERDQVRRGTVGQPETETL